MSVMRQGRIPYPPQGIGEGEESDEVYTLGGFFGEWAHIFRRHNLARPSSWSDDEVMYSGIDTSALLRSGQVKSGEHAVPLLEGDGVKVSLSQKQAEPISPAERNIDFHQIRFYQRGHFTVATELGPLEVGPGDFVVIGKGLIFREEPHGMDNSVVVFEVDEPIVLGERLWDSVGYASMFIDYWNMRIPSPAGEVEGSSPTDVRVVHKGKSYTLTYDFDPCQDAVGWVGDPVIYAMNVWDIPAIGTARGFLPPPAHAALLGENKSFFFNVLMPSPMPTTPAPGGSYGASAHLNDYDEVWFNHASEFAPETEEHMWLLPRTIPHPGFKRSPKYPSNPVRQPREVKINFDTRSDLSWSPEAKKAFVPGDVRLSVLTSMYGVRPSAIPEDVKKYGENEEVEGGSAKR